MYRESFRAVTSTCLLYCDWSVHEKLQKNSTGHLWKVILTWSLWRQSHRTTSEIHTSLVASTLKQFKTFKKRSWPTDKDTDWTPTLTPSTFHFVSLCVYNHVSFVFALTLILQFSVSPVFLLSLSHFSPSPFHMTYLHNTPICDQSNFQSKTRDRWGIKFILQYVMRKISLYPNDVKQYRAAIPAGSVDAWLWW